MKKVFGILPCLLLLVSLSFAKAMPNDKILKSFETTFFGTQDVKWYEHPDYCEVSFVQAGIRSNVRYDLQGRFLGSTRYYKEQQLPTNILFKLKNRYQNKNIIGVTEITNNDEIHYYVKMEDNKNLTTIKVNGYGQMEVYEKYKKA
jgi:hypothetical protein